mmetsp:Transcript_25647/g.52185  ORF Transcript_25647/g.52185 Transcript_25647/m.52185 type:complete len:185 (-) Transcript_25647:75-629(-)
MKRRQQEAPNGFLWEASPSTSRLDEDDLETWLRQIGLRHSDASRALKICETRYVHSVSDLRQICEKGQLNELFSHPFLCGRIESHFRLAADGGGDDENAMMGIEVPKPVHLKHDGVTVSCDVTPSTTIRQIKEYVCTNTCFGYPVQSQQIIFNGRQLSDDKTVGSYQIEPYSCLYLIASKISSW